MAVSVKIEGADIVRRKLEQMVGEVAFATQEEVKLSGEQVRAFAIKSIQAKSTSKGTVTRYNPRREQKVSAEGAFPNTDTGRLVGSIQLEHVEEGPGKLSTLVGTNLIYGAYLEFGTSDMRARPWLLPSFQATLPGNRKRIRNELRKAVVKRARKK